MSAAAPQPPEKWRFVLVAVLVALSLVTLIAWRSLEYSRSVAAQDQVARAFARERAQWMLLGAVREAEIAARQLARTGDSAFQPAYGAARDTARRLRAAADGRLTDAALAALDAMIAAGVVREDAPPPLRRLREAVADDMRAERARAADRLAESRRHHEESQQLLIVIGAVAGLLLLAVLAALWRSRRDRYDAARAVHAAAERHAAILASTSDTLLIVSPQGTIEMVNAAGCALLGYPPGALEGRDLATVLPQGTAAGDGLHERIGRSATRPPRDLLTEQVARRRDGGTLTVDVAIGVMPGGDGDRFVLSLRDASERQRLERAKDELISTVSHELRTPLTSVVGSLALLRAGTERDWSAQTRRLVDIADSNARRLIRLINDMLDIDRIESGQLTIARLPIDLRTITAQAALDGEALAQGRGVTLIDDPAPAPVWVAGDAGRLAQVVANLVSNAVQASGEGDRVTLRTRVTGGRAMVSVEDRGPGIAAALRPRLFDRFQSHRASGGTGLGLAIAREIVRRLDGTIRFEDRTGGGTRFVFDLPLLRATPAQPGGGVALPLVLHVEDDPDMREMVAAALTGVAEVVPATGLAAARSILSERTPDVALLDLHLTDGEGPALIDALSGRDGRAVPVVMLSGQTVPPAVAARVAAVLTKGRDGMAEVVAAVRRLLDARPPARERAR